MPGLILNHLDKWKGTLGISSRHGMFDFNVQPGLRTTSVGRGRFLIQDLKSDRSRQWQSTLKPEAKGKMWALFTLTKISSPSLDKVGKVNQISKIRNHDYT